MIRYFHVIRILHMSVTLTTLIFLFFFVDANFGMFAFMPQLAQKLGWSPLGRAVKIAQRVMEQRTGKPNVTFREVCLGFDFII